MTRQREKPGQSSTGRGCSVTLDDTAPADPPFRCDYDYNIRVGENVHANYDCLVLDAALVRSGRNCMIAPSAHVYTGPHSLEAAEPVKDAAYAKQIAIGDDVWVGGQATANPVASNGDEAVVASGAVVTGDVPDGVVVQGNLAEVIKEL